MDVRLVKAMVIGDGSLDVRHHSRNVNARLSITHGVKQKDYLFWKKDLLAAAGLTVWYSEFMNTTNPHTGKKSLMCRVESQASSVLTVLRDLLYPKSEGFKPGVLDDLEALHLAVIFMDDGCRQISKLNGGRVIEPYIASYQIALQSHGFSGARQFCDWLGSKFGIHASVWKQEGKAKVVVYRNKDKSIFREIVSPHVHPTLAYKLDGTFEARPACRERLSERIPVEVRGMRQSELAGNEPREGAPKSLPAGE